MSIAGASMTVTDAPADTGNPRMMGIARKQRLQDMAFHRITQLFSLLVLVALLGIIVSLFIFFNTFASSSPWPLVFLPLPPSKHLQ